MNSREKSGPTPWIALGISIASLALSSSISFMSLFYTQLYISEALDANLIDHRDSANGMVAHLVLINKGNQNIVITNLWFLYSREAWGGEFQPALRNDTDELISPILVGPREVKYVQARHLLTRMPAIGQPSPSREGAIDTPVTLVFTTIGLSGRVQKAQLPVWMITVKDGKYVGWAREKGETVHIRK
jgi:hypothetical protein